MRLIGYYRVSTDAQGESGLGLAAQKHCVRAQVALRGDELVAELTEVASGAKTDRELLNVALEMLRKGEAEGLIVHKVDRLTRSLKQFAQIMEQAKKQGWAVITEGIDMTTPTGRAMAGMLAVFAEFERDMISVRTSEGLQAKKRRQGGKLKGNKPSVPAAVVAGIRTRRDAGGSYRQIAAWLTLANIPTAQGGKWRGSTVKWILDNA